MFVVSDISVDISQVGVLEQHYKCCIDCVIIAETMVNWLVCHNLLVWSLWFRKCEMRCLISQMRIGRVRITSLSWKSSDTCVSHGITYLEYLE
jgi:hypothetical protein